MNFLQFFQSFFSRPHTATITPPFECPNCWGIQQWENENKALHFELNKDTTLIGKARKGFIQRFADRYVPGIQKPRRT